MAPREIKHYKIAELEKLSGLPRRTIHFYLAGKLLHSPARTGKTMAYYDEAHLKKLRFIREVKGRGVPLLAVRRMIADREAENAEAFGARLDPAFAREKAALPRSREPRKPKGIKTRETILESGSRLFREKGYRNTRVSDVTRGLNIGKGTFYFYFSDKKELFLECAPRIFRELFSRGLAEIREEKDPLKRLILRAETVLPVLSEFAVIIDLAREALLDPDPKVRKLGQDIILSIRRPLESDFENGIQRGLFSPGDKRIVGTLLIGIFESLSYLQAVNPEISPDEIKKTLFGLLTRGLSVPEKRKG